jgi:hypothetical protein
MAGNESLKRKRRKGFSFARASGFYSNANTFCHILDRV